MMIGVIDVGGGERAVYGAGVFDYCLDEGISFDCLIGVSAGSANTSNFLAGQKGRPYRFYSEYMFRPEAMSMANFLKTGSYVNLDYLYGKLSAHDGECPFDYETMRKNAAGRTLLIVATDADTGKPVYFTADDIGPDHYEASMCSSCVPLVNRPYPYRGGHYYDGGISDPIPLEKAFERGCDKVVVILTRPRDFIRPTARDEKMAEFLKYRYPKAARALAQRGTLYNLQVELAKAYEKMGKVLILAPDDIGGMSTLTKDYEQIELMYAKGHRDAAAIRAFLEGE